MPTTFTLDPDAKAVYLVHSGVLSDAEALATADRFLNMELAEGTVMIVDMRAVTSLKITPRCMHELIEAFRGNPRVTRCATIASSDLSFGVARQYQLLRDDSPPSTEMRVFRDSQAALDWLGLA